MDRGLKERLVGAAVLVAIGAWLIPWVLDGPQRLEPTEPAALELPAPALEEAGLRTETVALDRRESAPATEPAAPAPVAAPAPQPVPVAEPVKPRQATAPVEQATVAAEATPAASVAPEEPSPSDTTATTRWFAQVGAFGNVDNANRLAARVGTYGYDAQVTAAPGAGGTMHRVRIGPEPTRARAEAIASALSAHGFVARVVFE